MKSYFLTLVILFFLFPVAAQNSAEEKELLKINQAYDEAIKNADVSFYERTLANDYVSYGPDGSVKNRSQILEEVKNQKEKPAYFIEKMNSEDVNVKISGNLAVVTGKWNATTRAGENEEAHEDVGHYISVYEKRKGNWQLISEMGNEKPHSPDELETSLKKASSQYDETLKSGDKNAFQKLLAEDYHSTNSEGEMRNREQDIAMMFDPNLKMESISTEDKKFRIYRNFAIETGKYNVSGSYNDEKFTETGRYTSTWMYKDGKWQLVADHTSNIQRD